MIDIQKLINSAQHHIKRGDCMFMDPKVVKELAEQAKAQSSSAECNECEWSGSLNETLMCGTIGPLCPDCRETCQVSYPSKTAAPKHPDDVAVDRFAQAMKQKLAQAREKGRSGWQQMKPADISAMLYEHLEKGDPRDVANFCMFLWNLGQPISPSRAIQAEPFMPVMQFRVEIARLTECLERANSQAEHFERNWYLRGDEIEALKTQLASAVAQVEPVPDVVQTVLVEMSRATAKFPTWPTDPLHAIAVLGEEFGELTQAVLQRTYEPHKASDQDVRTEAIQTAAMALRFLMSLGQYEYTKCEQHVQGELHGKN